MGPSSGSVSRGMPDSCGVCARVVSRRYWVFALLHILEEESAHDSRIFSDVTSH